MNKLVFDAQIIGLRSVDYEYLQDSVESYSNKLYRQLLSNPNIPAIIQGFDLKIDSLDNTKLAVDTSSTTGLGGLITQDSMIIETSTGISSISLSDATLGTVNYVYAHYYTVKGSYDISTDSIREEIKVAIDLYDYTLEYNRQLDKVEIVVMTAAECAVVTSTGDYIYLGNTTAQGAGQPLTSIDKTGIVYTLLALPSAQIEVSNLSPSFLLPQSMVDNSEVYDDVYSSTPTTVEDDLNKIRTEIKNIKGTPTWESVAGGNLSSFDAAPDRLHINGVVENYGAEFTTTIQTSSGIYYARVESGKALVNGYIYPIYLGDYRYLTLPDIAFSDHGYTTGVETHSGVYAGVTFALNEFSTGATINAATILVYASSGILYNTVPGSFTYTPEYGTITMHADTTDGFVHLWYKYGFKQYQSIDLTSTGEYIVQSGNYSYPPYQASINGLRLFSILRNPFIAPSTSDFIDYRTYTRNIREVTDINQENYTTAPYTVDQVTYYTSTGLIDTTFSKWTITSTGTTYAETSTNGAYFISNIRCRENDEVYVRITKPLSDDSYNFTVSYEATPNSDIFTDVTFTNIQESNISSDNVLIFVVKGLSEGYHRIKVKNTTTTGTLRVYGITYGKLDSYYTKDSIIFMGNVISKGSIVSSNIGFTSNWAMGFNPSCSSVDFTRNSTMYARISETNSCINSNLGVNGELNLNGTNNFKYGTSCWTTYFNTGCSSIDFNRGSTMYARISETNSCINSNLGVNGELNLNGTNNFKFGASNWTMCYYPTCNSIDFNYSGTYSMRLTQNNLNVACMSTNTITIGTCLTMNGELNLAGTNNFKFGTSTWCMKYNSSYASIDFNYGGSTKARLYSTGNLAVVGIFQEVTSLLA